MTSKRKKQQRALISNIIFSTITLISLTISIVFVIFNLNLKKDVEQVRKENQNLFEYSQTHKYTQEDMDALEFNAKQESSEKTEQLLAQIRNIMDEGNSAYYLLRTLYPDEIVVVSNTGFDFYPIDKNLKLNTYNLDSFKQDDETKEIIYDNPSDNVKAHKSIDVSSFNEKIDWKKVAESDVDYAIIRCGYRGSSEGKLMLDSTFEYNLNQANENDVPAGVYFFSQAISEEEAVEEAQYVLEAVSDYDLELPIAIDVEKLEGRTDLLTKDERTDYTIAFLEEIKKSGYDVMIYGNLNTFMAMLDIKRLEDYPKWFAYYSNPVYFPYEFDVWQYTDTGTVDGIKGKVDINICMKEYVK